MTAVVLDTWVDWGCPNCLVTDRTRPLPVNAQRWHACAGLHGLKAPLVEAGTDCKVYAQERQDYLGREEQRTGDDGKPYMAVVTERVNGCDVAVFAPVATARLGE